MLIDLPGNKPAKQQRVHFDHTPVGPVETVRGLLATAALGPCYHRLA